MSMNTRQRQGRDFPKPGDYLKNAEMSMEGNYNMVGDGIINNTAPPRDDLTDGQTYDEIRNLAPESLPEGRQSVLERLEQLREHAKAAVSDLDFSRLPLDGHEPPER